MITYHSYHTFTSIIKNTILYNKAKSISIRKEKSFGYQEVSLECGYIWECYFLTALRTKIFIYIQLPKEDKTNTKPCNRFKRWESLKILKIVINIHNFKITPTPSQKKRKKTYRECWSTVQCYNSMNFITQFYWKLPFSHFWLNNRHSEVERNEKELIILYYSLSVNWFSLDGKCTQ